MDASTLAVTVPDWLTSALSTIGGAVLIAAMTSWITVRLSIRQFREQRWWERKADAYAELLTALAEVHLDYARTWVKLERRKDQSNDEEESARLKEAHWRINILITTSAFMFPARVAERLAGFAAQWDEAEEADIFEEYLANAGSAVRDCLDDLQVMARADLRVGRVRNPKGGKS